MKAAHVLLFVICAGVSYLLADPLDVRVEKCVEVRRNGEVTSHQESIYRGSNLVSKLSKTEQDNPTNYPTHFSQAIWYNGTNILSLSRYAGQAASVCVDGEGNLNFVLNMQTNGMPREVSLLQGAELVDMFRADSNGLLRPVPANELRAYRHELRPRSVVGESRGHGEPKQTDAPNKPFQDSVVPPHPEQ